jgi:hypothetical protein
MLALSQPLSAAPPSFSSSPGTGQETLGLKRTSRSRHRNSGALTEDTLALAKMLNIDETLAELKKVVSESGENPTDSQLIRIIFLRQKCERATQFASLELEEALAYLDGDLSYTNMQYSIFSAKHERSIALNNTATFITSGTLGILDSASGLKYGTPVPNIFGITGNASAVAIPLWGLRPRQYKPLQQGHSGNSLAPIFGLPFDDESYDPIIWKYLNARALDENATQTRRETLLSRWKQLRKLDVEKDEAQIRRLCGLMDKDEKITLDLLKTRAELLVELRTEVQTMYTDLSDLNSEVMKY